jgi:hypothetical protein
VELGGGSQPTAESHAPELERGQRGLELTHETATFLAPRPPGAPPRSHRDVDPTMLPLFLPAGSLGSLVFDLAGSLGVSAATLWFAIALIMVAAVVMALQVYLHCETAARKRRTEFNPRNSRKGPVNERSGEGAAIEGSSDRARRRHQQSQSSYDE